MNVTYEHKPAMSFIGFSTSMNAASGYRFVRASIRTSRKQPRLFRP